MLFFGAFIIPVLLGCLLCSVPHNMRGSANSVAQFAYNAFGYMPAPFIYGSLSQFLDKQNGSKKREEYSAIPMMSIVYMTFISLAVFTQIYREKYLKARH